MSQGHGRSTTQEAWPAAAIFVWAGLVAVVMSSEFLAQPFIWRSWSLADIAAGWAMILADRLIVALAIGACIYLAARTPVRRPAARVLWLVVAALAGAASGEGLRFLFDAQGERQDLTAALGRVAAWTIVSAAMIGTVEAWRSGAALTARAEAARVRAAQLRQLTTAMQLEALRRQIEPHFLFNTLATIKRLGRTAPHDGQKLLSRLLEFVSATFAVEGLTETTLGQELDLARAYLDVCQARMGERLAVTWRVDAALRDARFPPLMLGTLLENAIKHGLAPLESGGAIIVSAAADGPVLEVTVQDTGRGIEPQGGAGIGLANLVTRLRLLHGAQASFRLEAVIPNGLRAVIRTPHARLA